MIKNLIIKAKVGSYQSWPTYDEWLLHLHRYKVWQKCCRAPQTAVRLSLSSSGLSPKNECSLPLYLELPGKSGLCETGLTRRQRWRLQWCWQTISWWCWEELEGCLWEGWRKQGLSIIICGWGSAYGYLFHYRAFHISAVNNTVLFPPYHCSGTGKRGKQLA